MAKYSYQVKHDTEHRVWHNLSVTTVFPMLSIGCADYVIQYAQDHQMNPHMIAIRCIDESGNVVYTIESNATANRPQ